MNGYVLLQVIFDPYPYYYHVYLFTLGLPREFTLVTERNPLFWSLGNQNKNGGGAYAVRRTILFKRNFKYFKNIREDVLTFVLFKDDVHSF